jgi:hypothetical protein
MKRKMFFGIYGKIMSYTLLTLLAVVIIAAAFFSRQIAAALENMERQQLSNVFAPLIEQLDGKSDEEAIKISEEFHSKNTVFEFYIMNDNEDVIYNTPGSVPRENDNETNVNRLR